MPHSANHGRAQGYRNVPLARLCLCLCLSACLPRPIANPHAAPRARAAPRAGAWAAPTLTFQFGALGTRGYSWYCGFSWYCGLFMRLRSELCKVRVLVSALRRRVRSARAPRE